MQSTGMLGALARCYGSHRHLVSAFFGVNDHPEMRNSINPYKLYLFCCLVVATTVNIGLHVLHAGPLLVFGLMFASAIVVGAVVGKYWTHLMSDTAHAPLKIYAGPLLVVALAAALIAGVYLALCVVALAVAGVMTRAVTDPAGFSRLYHAGSARLHLSTG